MSHTATDTGLVLQPFRGLRYSADIVDLGAVTSPPYDVIGSAQARLLEAGEPHNLVRLTLPDTSAAPSDQYRRARTLLSRWRAAGVLRQDDDPALYVYEAEHDGRVQRGLLGGVGLRPPQDRVVLPHEDTHPAPVADRAAQMRATRANLEPIFLLTPGLGAAADVIETVAATPPSLTAPVTVGSFDASGGVYRLWAVTDPGDLATVAGALSGRQALIADGHHRYAAYRTLAEEHRGTDGWSGGWDFGLALLVDSAAYPPTLRPIHRVVRRLSPADLVAALPAAADVRRLDGGIDAALTSLAQAGRHAGDAHVFLVAGDDYRLVTLPAPAAGGNVEPGHCPQWYRLDVTAVHSLLHEVLHVAEERLAFPHAADDAVRLARQEDGVAVLLNPPTETAVFDIAAAQDRMPRKSTSFGPKPLGGLVMRLADDGVG